MALTKTNNWQFSFYYEQDLRSKYMNHILSGVLQPGIYNAGIELVHYKAQSGEAPDSFDGWYLHIKKGTTLVFSNGYTNAGENDSRLVRDLNTVGSYTIKCTAQEDMYSSRLASTYNNNNTDLDGCYITAKIAYSDQEKTDFTTPVFSIVKALQPEGDNSDVFGFEELSKEVSNYSIPDGTAASDTSEKMQVSWLMVGRLNGVKLSDNGFEGSFVARGLPEYTSAGITEKLSLRSASLISSSAYGNNYLPVPVLGSVWVDNDIYSYNDGANISVEALYKTYSKVFAEENLSKISSLGISDGLLMGFLYKTSDGLKFAHRSFENIIASSVESLGKVEAFNSTGEFRLKLDIDRRNIEKFVAAIKNQNTVGNLVSSLRSEISNNVYNLASTVIIPLYIAIVENGAINPSKILDLIDLQSGRNRLSHVAFATPQYLSTINVLND